MARAFLWMLIAGCCFALSGDAVVWGQQTQFPPYYGSSPMGGGSIPAGTAPPQATPPSVWPSPAGTAAPTTPGMGTVPVSPTTPPLSPYPGIPSPPPVGAAAPPAAQPFDPYSTTVTAPVPPWGGLSPNSTATPGYPASSTWLPGNIPPAPTVTSPTPGLGDPTPFTPGFPGSVPVATPIVPPPGAPTATPQGPRPLFPTDPFTGPNPPFQRLFQDTGFRYTFLYGDAGDQLQIHEADISTTLVLPNLLGGLRFSPGFTFDFLNGPTAPGSSDLPNQLYAGYVDAWWNPQLTQCLTGEFNVRVGVYSDFQTVTSDSIRVISTGVGVLKVTPTMSAKLGAAYIDRNRIKLLPAAGILIEPNPKSRWDIFFPAPKLSHYLTTNRNTEWWWYLGGEYGGGAWTIERPEPPSAGASESIDINDIRVFLGFEGWNVNRCFTFFEVGYVFDREIVYVLEPTDSMSLDDTFMLRAGVSF